MELRPNCPISVNRWTVNPDTQCWIWKSRGTNPTITIGKKIRHPVYILWEHQHNRPARFKLINTCGDTFCVNIDHWQMHERQYHKHTADCSGHDWALVELVTQAGTIDIIPKDEHICDCDRAAMILKFDTPTEAIHALHLNNKTYTKLLDLGKQLWPTSTQS